MSVLISDSMSFYEVPRNTGFYLEFKECNQKMRSFGSKLQQLSKNLWH